MLNTHFFNKRVFVLFIIFLNIIFTSNNYYALYAIYYTSNAINSTIYSQLQINNNINNSSTNYSNSNTKNSNILNNKNNSNSVIDNYEHILVKYATLDFEYIEEYSKVIILLDLLLNNKNYTNYQKNKVVYTIITEYDRLKHEFKKYNVSIYDIISIILTESEFNNIKKIDNNGEYSIGIFQIQYVAYKYVFNKWNDLKGNTYNDYLNMYNKLDIQIKVGMRYYLLMLKSTNNKYYALNRYNGRKNFKDINSPYIKRFNKMKSKVKNILMNI